ncbi:PEPxxWA-CTERM sorting domain-containing protein [Azoarcus communis]|uniref:PEP-CTERM sorting domain-containing protein n=1 Tax=Parazoarcus communis SWub3 = DSM 12120 TaxID=1121029 RepID=A0A323V2X5_9RHOO|nr:PEP-CTERM sorting domain-containing protein [Parazoarcus communis]NMG48642.1 PEPxxWA-CTERM sorting domain-containing protein [Parazoarcus communis]NMG69218.1 PEPxxWA-CTERM sorting domain-containing protein [Parazoarcus communis SWub3 = DSM 12120]PZA18463.1 PEP-CTERM sorting domain-containing protein [Azoarcus communis] [Parazoarcus communis SWub3 = DSM 12120]
MKLNTLIATAALATVVAAPAQAALVNDAALINNSMVVTFDDFDGLETTGPVAVGTGVTFSGTPSTLGAYIADLGSNGTWFGNFAATGDSNYTDFGILHFTFDNAMTAAAGAFLNSYNGGPILLAAYNAAGTMIEAHFVSVATDEFSYNEGSFFGISRANADIRSIAFGGVGLVADNLTFAAPVPEPETYAMLLAGLGLVGFMARRRSAR